MKKVERALVFGPIDVADAVAVLVETGAPITLRSGAWLGHDITDLQVTQHTDQYETTRMGDVAPTYIAGLTRTEVSIELVYNEGAGMPPLGRELEFDQVSGVWRIRGRVLVTAVTVMAHAGSMMRLSIRAIGTGPFMIEYADPEPAPMPLPQEPLSGGRAMAFGGIGDV